MMINISPESSLFIKDLAETSLRQKYAPGVYEPDEQCNEILKCIFDFYEQTLDSLIPLIASHEWVAEIIYQHEIHHRISKKYRNGELSEMEHDQWQADGPVLLQTLDYLLEKLCEYNTLTNIAEPKAKQVTNFEKAYICAKNCVRFAGLSNHMMMILPGITTITIRDPGERTYFAHKFKEDVHERLMQYLRRVNSEILLREKYITTDRSPLTYQYLTPLLDPAFKTAFGITFSQFQVFITSAVVNSQPISRPGNVPVQTKEIFVQSLTDSFDLSVEQAETLLRTVIVDGRVKRKVWDSRQEDRVNKKPFLQFKWKGKLTLFWSESKISNYFALLDADLAFSKIPLSWEGTDIQKTVAGFSNLTGDWFEGEVKRELQKIGYIGISIEDSINKKYPYLNFNCGQVDYLAYHPHIGLVIFEVKIIETGFDSRGFRKVKAQFLTGSNAHVNKFTKKIQWLIQNFAGIRRYMEDEHRILIPADTKMIYATFLTYYPSIMDLFFDKIPIRSLIEFIEESSSKSLWPYSGGRFQINQRTR